VIFLRRNISSGFTSALKESVLRIFIALKNPSRRLGGVVVSVLATGPKGCVFKTRPRRWTSKGDNNPQHTFLSDVK
jgi:hypothetical protein